MEDGIQNELWDTFAPALRGGGEFDPRKLSAETGVPLPEIEETLLRFQDAGYLTYRASPRQILLELLPAPPDTRQRMEATLVHRAKGQDERVQAMQAYAKEQKCRHGQIARYFGDRWPNLPCGMCDVCVKSNTRATAKSSGTLAPARSAPPGGGQGGASVSPEKAPIAALQIVHDLAQGYRPFAIGKSGLLKALRGTPDAPIKQDRTSAFGALAEYKKSEVERLIEALLEQGYLRRDEEDEYRRLYLTGEGGRAITSGEADVEWRSASPSNTGTTRSGRGTVADLPDDVDTVLLETLKSWRRNLAQADNVPPYVVFADKVLIGVASKQPTNEFDLLEIPGIGPAKAAKYGDTVLEMVRRHRGG